MEQEGKVAGGGQVGLRLEEWVASQGPGGWGLPGGGHLWMWAWNVGRRMWVGHSPVAGRPRLIWVLGSKAAGLGRTQHMGDQWQSSLYDHRTSEAEGRPERGQKDSAPGLPSPVYESRGSRDTKYQDPDDGQLGLEGQEEEIPPEEVTGEEFLGTKNPEEALPELEKVLEKDVEEGVPEMRCVGGWPTAWGSGGGPWGGCPQGL